jgi:hypothetical protein
MVTLGVVFATTASCRPFGNAQGVTASRIRRLMPGMSESDVLGLLGPPRDSSLGADRIARLLEGQVLEHVGNENENHLNHLPD